MKFTFEEKLVNPVIYGAQETRISEVEITVSYQYHNQDNGGASIEEEMQLGGLLDNNSNLSKNMQLLPAIDSLSFSYPEFRFSKLEDYLMSTSKPPENIKYVIELLSKLRNAGDYKAVYNKFIRSDNAALLSVFGDVIYLIKYVASELAISNGLLTVEVSDSKMAKILMDAMKPRFEEKKKLQTQSVMLLCTLETLLARCISSRYEAKDYSIAHMSGILILRKDQD